MPRRSLSLVLTARPGSLSAPLLVVMVVLAAAAAAEEEEEEDGEEESLAQEHTHGLVGAFSADFHLGVG